MKPVQGFLALALLCTALFGLSCTPERGVETAVVQPVLSGADIESTAVAQATMIIQRAQATALVLQANQQANAIISGATQTPTEQLEPVGSTTAPQESQLTPTATVHGSPAAVEVIRVSFAAEGGFIIVDYKADPDTAESFWPGVVSVTDEGTGTVYNEVPVMPKIGPMISRPVLDGQVGYVLFVNAPPYLQKGTLVTVKLANYIFEHIIVE
jgi:hypothetical protein